MYLEKLILQSPHFPFMASKHYGKIKCPACLKWLDSLNGEFHGTLAGDTDDVAVCKLCELLLNRYLKIYAETGKLS